MTKDFVIKSIKNADWSKELEYIGFDKSYRHKVVDKFLYKNLKIYGLTPAQANIIKQTALSFGADCATHREVITGNVDNSDVILGGSFSQLNKISEKLKHQPFSLSVLADKITEQLVEKTNKTKIVGILNLTSNSFSDGGLYNSTEKACERISELVSDGADVIDIGAESTKPMAQPVSPEEQLKKIIPILDYVRSNQYDITLSVDTRSAIVAEECIKNGVTIINDVSGLKYDKDMAETIAKNNATVVLQHSLGNDINMVQEMQSEHIIDDVFLDLQKQIEYAKFVGIDSIIIDPGLGFDKNREDNFRIINRIEEFFSLGYPVMTGVSRKSLLNLKDRTNDVKDIYTLALNTLAIEHHVDYIRVHNVKLHKDLIDIYQNSIL